LKSIQASRGKVNFCDGVVVYVGLGKSKFGYASWFSGSIVYQIVEGVDMVNGVIMEREVKVFHNQKEIKRWICELYNCVGNHAEAIVVCIHKMDFGNFLWKEL
jgi:hypothetical protein